MIGMRFFLDNGTPFQLRWVPLKKGEITFVDSKKWTRIMSEGKESPPGKGDLGGLK
jgi:hypothetical protein